MTAKILDDTSYLTPTFTERQFDPSPTAEQIAFDVMLGIILPIFCLYYDPGILGGNLDGFIIDVPILRYKLAIYVLSGMAMATLALWLWLRQRLQHSSVFIGTCLLTGAALSFMIGIVIAPLTLVGLIFGIGIFGLVPFLTAFVYLRNGFRAVEQADAAMPRFRLVASLLLSALLVIGVPAATEWQVSRMVSESVGVILHGDTEATDQTINRLKYVKWLVNKNQILQAYQSATDYYHRQQLAKLYAAIAGESIERGLSVMGD